MEVFIDLQGFKGANNTFIPKEIAILQVGCRSRRFILKKTFSIDKLSKELKYQVKWLQKNYHGFDWNDGVDDLYSVKLYLLDHNLHTCRIFVKGLEKKRWLIKLFPIINESNITNLDDFGCPSIKFLQQRYRYIRSCNTHYGNCAWQNCYLVQQWYQQENREI